MNFLILLTVLVCPILGQTQTHEQVDTIVIKAKRPQARSKASDIKNTSNFNTNLQSKMTEQVDLNFVQSGASGQMSSLFTRGTETRHTKLVIDDIGITDPSTPDGAMDFGHLSLDELESARLIPGPQTVLYGEGAIGGVLKLPSQRNQAPALVLGLGEGRNRIIGARYQFEPFPRTRLKVKAERREQTLQSNLNPRRFSSQEKDSRKFTAMGLALEQTITSQNYAEITLNFKTDKVGLDDFPFAGASPVLDDPNRTLTTDQVSLSTKWKHTSFGGKANHQWIYRRDTFKRIDEDLADTPAETNSMDVFKGEQVAYANRTEINWNENQKSKIGLEWVEELDQGANSDTSVKDLSKMSLYGKHYSKTNIVDVALGARHTDREAINAQAIEFELQKETTFGLSNRIYTAQGFKLPSLFQLNSQNFGNNALSEEKSLTWGAAISQEWTKKHKTELEYYSTELKNLIDFDSTTSRYTNRNRSQIRGWQLSQSSQLSNMISLKVGGGLLAARDKDTGRRLARRSRYQLSSKMDVSLNDDNLISLKFARKGKSEDGGVTLDPYNLIGAQYSYRFDRDMMFSLVANNITDEIFEPAFGYQGQRRSVLALVKWSPR